MTIMPAIALIASLTVLATVGGGSYTWASGVAGVIAAAGACLALAGRKRVFPSSTLPSRGWRRVDMLLLIALGLAVATAVPLPLLLTRLTGGWRFQQNAAVADALRIAADQALLPSSGAAWFSFSRNGAGTQRALVRFAVMVLCAAIAASLAVRRRQHMALAVTVLGTAVAALGCVSIWWTPQGDTLWWVTEVPHHFPGPVACFINRNHFGGFAGMLAPAAAALAIHGITARRWEHLLPGVLSFGILVAACMASVSRGAVLALAAGMAGLLLALASQGRRKLAVGGALALALLGVFVYHSIDDDSRERLSRLANPSETQSGQYRLTAWRETVRIWQHHPVAGTGLNSFPMVYPLYRTTTDSAYMSHAESEYVQLLAETGLIGLALVALLGIAVFKQLQAGREQGVPPLLTQACVGATAAAAMHAVVDSPMHIPLYAATWAALVGLAMPPPGGEEKTAHTSRPPAVILLCVLIAIVPGLLCKPVHWKDSLSSTRESDAPAAARALVMSPTSWNHWFQLGKKTYQRGDADRTAFAALCLSQAGAYDLNNYRLWRSIGKFRLRTGDHAGAREAFDRVRSLRDWVQLPGMPEDAE